MSRTCQLCTKPLLAKGLCSMHYSRQWRHGDPNIRYREGTRILEEDYVVSNE